MILTRSLEEVFFARRCEFSWFHCSASRASLVQVRAMSSRMSFTRAFEVCSANRRHSAE
jgi:hypothetical protein